VGGEQGKSAGEGAVGAGSRSMLLTRNSHVRAPGVEAPQARPRDRGSSAGREKGAEGNTPPVRPNKKGTSVGDQKGRASTQRHPKAAGGGKKYLYFVTPKTYLMKITNPANRGKEDRTRKALKSQKDQSTRQRVHHTGRYLRKKLQTQ